MEPEHRLVVDRFEGDLVAVEVDGGALLDLPWWLLPPEAREGDVLRARVGPGPGGWVVHLLVDEAGTRAAREQAETMLRRLRARDPGGDLEL